MEWRIRSQQDVQSGRDKSTSVNRFFNQGLIGDRISRKCQGIEPEEWSFGLHCL